MGRDFNFSIDRGGTFTDVFAEVPDHEGGSTLKVLKLLSEDPNNYSDAPREGIRRILEEVTGKPYPRSAPLDTSRISSIRMGTTVATNALLERKGERTALVVTSGFPDLLHIANQSRPNIFDLEIRSPDKLYERIVEVDELVMIPLGSEPNQRNGADAANNARLYAPEGSIRKATTGEVVCVRREPDLNRLRADLQSVLDDGISSIAVVLKHSAIFPDHEAAVGRVAQEMGFQQISLSSVVMPMVKMVPRGFTAAADAYLTPHIMRYIQTFQSGFDSGLSKVQVLFMQSDGGLSRVEGFCGHKAVLSGPAGGYVGYALTTKWEGMDSEHMQAIGFDMGGTSTDVSRFAGSYEHVFETTTAGVTIQAPQLDINTVAAGGGSRLFFRAGLFVVGPESAAAHPGPVCYKKRGGVLAITDANLALGRVLPEFFPKIFGPAENEALDAFGTNAAFAAMAEEVNAYERQQGRPPKTIDEIAMGFVTVANETMCRPIRALTQMKGYDAAAHILACFGGAGAQHACAIAKSLGMKTIFVHRFAGILSAVGIHLADIVQEAQEPCAATLTGEAGQEQRIALDARLERLEVVVKQQLEQQGFSLSQIKTERFLNLRYQGTDIAVMTSRPPDGDYIKAFEAAYVREFGFKLDRGVLADDVRVRGTGSSKALQTASGNNISDPAGLLPQPVMVTSVYFEGGGRQDTPVFQLPTLKPQHKLPGPVILIDKISTIVVEPGWVATITADGNVRMDLAALSLPKTPSTPSMTSEQGTACDPIQLAIFSHRFMGIAEQMGRTLQRTSISVNIKERLDFSCALFGPDGSLVANAPHLPVHLGAMSEAVRFQVRYYTEGPGKEEGLSEGDVLLSNHPQLAGGSHLPDITAITPVHSGGSIVFFVASRGHHADIGGISPGSMPPHSKLLVEEGAAIVSFKIVRKGVFQEDGITRLLMAPGTLNLPGVKGTRNLDDNLSDLRAQVAANTRGIQLVGDLIEEYGLNVVQAYMGHIQRNAELAVRDMLKDFSLQQGLPEVGTVHAEDQMDDGTPIKLEVTIDRRDGSAVFDFEGTGPEVYGNSNAPPAVAYSAIIYSLRCMVTRDIPLNQGCLAPITVRIPQSCLLNPSATAAVVGGNVLTSQRVTDVVLKAFSAAAASQGCMNNFTFGDEGMGYYETIAGGAGAGPGWHGRSGVHTHMTNTRITDPEILERRYPVLLHCFKLRSGSGGSGFWRGGEGVIREIEALRPIDAGILSERRSVRPFGLLGGGPALPGLNLLVRNSGHVVNLGGKATVKLQAGERLRIITPGGGGYGEGGEGDPEELDVMIGRGLKRPASGNVADVGLEKGSVLEYRRRQETA
ncbi:hypothetical protein CEUSTIGMA_g13296.t1 [Chlamydomonas eustigma]|uniref:5-oxoprolinase n=1 Tax=Chlamydomonas eustigma TaxID=1157962 RepID=A0A250XSU7_9CHLO|nr:hypothetical protein CEUSTIGMA_g13296.t1 [Chlamydomonas eustigma]|eukprot:GAX85880.1 hypothetical protein CEUSTIGMA_g13296.t1 [Chlamydomonas eustigma]